MLIRTGVRKIHAVEFGRNKAKEYEYSGPGRVSCCGEASFSAAGARKVAWSRRGQDAMGTPSCRFPRRWKSCRGVLIW